MNCFLMSMDCIIIIVMIVMVIIMLLLFGINAEIQKQTPFFFLIIII